MEFKPSRHDQRNRINVPRRGENGPTRSTPAHHFSAPEKFDIPKDLASQRESLGFDDIPVGDENMDNVRFRDILRAWAKQGVKNSPIEKQLQKAATEKGRLHKIKNDLKWAMQADLDEPVAPKSDAPKQSSHPRIATHVNKDAAVPPVPSSKTIDINITLGSLPKIPTIPKHRIPSLQNIIGWLRSLLFAKKTRIMCGVVVILIAGYFAASSLVKQYAISKNAGTGDAGNSKQITETPTYATLLPQNMTISELGGWKRVSPPKSEPVFAYADKISGTPISVSQQKIPQSFKPDIDDQVAELAKNFSATDKVDAGGTKVYIGTSSKGPQSVILVKHDTLILIKSQAKVSDDAWITYVQALE